jgi:hypothetical protein
MRLEADIAQNRCVDICKCENSYEHVYECVHTLYIMCVHIYLYSICIIHMHLCMCRFRLTVRAMHPLIVSALRSIIQAQLVE